MKNIFTLPALILIILSHNGCRSTKTSNRHQNRVSVQEQYDIKARVQEFNDYSSSESLSDSSGRSFQLTIFPADTFQFSLQHGFIGKASKVVLRGSSKQVIRLTDTSRIVSSKTFESVEKVRRDSLVKMNNRSVSVEKRGRIWQGIGIGLIIGLILFCLKTEKIGEILRSVKIR